MGIYKKFSQDLYDKYDHAGTDAVLSHLLADDCYAARNDDQYGPDIILYSGFRPVAYIEVEVRSGWTSGDFPWKLVNILERKLKYLGGKLSCDIWILSNDLKNCVIVAEKSIGRAVQESVGNTEISSGEEFRRVPIEECVLLILGD